MTDLRQPRVISLGAPIFAAALRQQGAEVVHLDWRPPAGGDPDLLAALQKLQDPRVDAANQRALSIIRSGHPMLVDTAVAGDVIPGLTPRTILHAGPPITWARMCGPQRGAVMGALLLEGLAGTPEEAAALAASGEITFASAHEHDAVGPMAGVMSYSSGVFVVKNQTHGNVAYTNINEGYGKVLRMGAYAPEVLERLRWLNTEYREAVGRALRSLGGIDLRSQIAQALHMGDEVHNRNKAAGALLTKTLAPALLRASVSPRAVERVLDFTASNEIFYVNLAMAACKATLDAALGIPHSSVVVTMARNGTDFGIRVAGTGRQWFTGPAQMIEGLYFPGFTAADANPDMGDSAITETAGLGGFAMAAAPAIVQFVGGTPDLALRMTQEMYEITLDESPHFTIPALNFRGTPTGIDVRLVVETGRLPNINTGIAHKQPGVGQVGAGLVHPPMACFAQALRALADTL